jgi:hypothetical protein
LKVLVSAFPLNMVAFPFYLFTVSIYFITAVVLAVPFGTSAKRDLPISLQPWYYVKEGSIDRGGCDDYEDELQEAYVEVIAMAQG